MGASRNTQERRSASRHAMRRRALFIENGATPRLGHVSDASAGGLRIETDAPPGIGTELDIEVHPASQEWTGTLRLRGRVVYVSDRGGMGVRLLPDLTPRRLPGQTKPRPAARRRFVLPPFAIPASRPGRWSRRRWLPVAALVLVVLAVAAVSWRQAATEGAGIAAPAQADSPPPLQPAADAPKAEPRGPVPGYRLVVGADGKRAVLYRQERPVLSVPVEFEETRPVRKAKAVRD